MKERVTLTLEKELLQRIDKSVNNTDVKNRSHAIELLLTKAMGENKPSRAIILAGGKKQLHEGLPRAMIRIQNKPVLEHNIALLKKFGIVDIIISIGQKGEMIKEHFGDGKEFGVKITYLEEETPLGTAGPLNKLKGRLNETFLLLNADELKNIDIEDMFMFHRKNKGLVTIALTVIEDASEYGVAVVNGQRIVTFIEKPNKYSPSKLINAGLYIVEPEVLRMIPEGYSMLEQDVFPKLAHNDSLLGYVFSGQWFDTSTKEHIIKTNAEWLGFK